MIWQNELQRKFPRILGHEAAGCVSFIFLLIIIIIRDYYHRLVFSYVNCCNKIAKGVSTCLILLAWSLFYQYLSLDQ